MIKEESSVMYIEKVVRTLMSDRDVKRSTQSELKKSGDVILSIIKNHQDEVRKHDEFNKVVSAMHGEVDQSSGATSATIVDIDRASSDALTNGSDVLPPLASNPSGCEADSKCVVPADVLFVPFRIACQTKNAKLVVIALDSIQKLVAYGHLSYKSVSKDAKPSEQQNVGGKTETANIPKITTVASQTEEDTWFDDRVVSVVCECFCSGPATDENVQLQILKAILTIVTSPNIRVHQNSLLFSVRTVYNIYLASRNQVNQTTARATLSQMINYSLAAMEQADVEEKVNSNFQQNLSELNERGIETGSNSSSSVESIAKSIVNEIVSRAQCEVNTKSSVSSHFALLIQKDVFLVFRSMCKLSMKPLPSSDYPLDPRSHELRSKILSLQLILAILQNGGSCFQDSQLFVYAIKTYLCVSLSQNGLSDHSVVYETSIDIFIILVKKYRTFLKSQIGIFFKDVCLNILESSSSTVESKWVIVKKLVTICSDSQLVVDLYLNYDCDLSFTNVFERLVVILSKISQSKQILNYASHDSNSNISSNGTNHRILQKMRRKSLECLSCVLRCMVDWSLELYVDPHNVQKHLSSVKETNSNELNNSVTVLSSNSMDSYEYNNNIKSSVKNVNGVKDGNVRKYNNSKNNDDFHQFEKVKAHKSVFERGVKLFNTKPKKGIEYFFQHNIIAQPSNAEEKALLIAEFLHNQSTKSSSSGHYLDKSVLGEYLGDLQYKDVMYAYVDRLHFEKVDFVSALRLFLSEFRLPGEAQKIDRLMEKFASRYLECYPRQNVFHSADAAYVLAYSVIMLTTDLHSSHIKKKMTKEEFIKNNSGINEREDIPSKYLSDIYDSIASSEIKVKAESGSFSSNSNNSSNSSSHESTSRKLYRLRNQWTSSQRDSISQSVGALMESAAEGAIYTSNTAANDGSTADEEQIFVEAKQAEHVKPMFKLIWSPILAKFSVELQDSNEMDICLLCIDGMQCAIRISNLFALDLERNAFIQALTRFTMLLDESSSIDDHSGDHHGSYHGSDAIKPKNMEAIKAIIALAYTDGNYLGESWFEVLKCISHLELAQLLNKANMESSSAASSASHVMMSTLFYPTALFLEKLNITNSTTDDHSNVPNGTFDSLATSKWSSVREANSQDVIVAVDRIFTGSSNLDGNAIVHFVAALCQVSRDEICCVNGGSHLVKSPRMFSLVKLVEISYYNMGRIRLEWSRIWHVIGPHFNFVGTVDSADISFFAVDSLKQLALKFIEKGELPSFHFQKDFLRPFEVIMKRNKSLQIRDMVIRCLSQMVQTQYSNIKSGWQNVFTTLALAASDFDETEAVSNINSTSVNNKSSRFKGSSPPPAVNKSSLLDKTSILLLSFQTCCNAVQSLMTDATLSLQSSFHAAVKCLAEFASAEQSHNQLDLAMEAIRLLRLCSKYVFDHWSAVGENENVEKIENSIWVRAWFPLLFELSCIINKSRLDLRTRSLTVLFDIAKSYGHTFHVDWWHDFYAVVFRLFDIVSKDCSDLGHTRVRFSAETKQSGSDGYSSSASEGGDTGSGAILQSFTSQEQRREWMDTTCNHTLYAATDVFNQYFSTLCSNNFSLFNALLDRFLTCIVNFHHHQLANSASSCLVNVITFNAETISSDSQMTMFVIYKLAQFVKNSSFRCGGQQSSNQSSHPTTKSMILSVKIHLEVLSSVSKILNLPLVTSSTESANQPSSLIFINVLNSGENIEIKPYTSLVHSIVSSQCWATQSIAHLLHGVHGSSVSSSVVSNLLNNLVKLETVAFKLSSLLMMHMFHVLQSIPSHEQQNLHCQDENCCEAKLVSHTISRHVQSPLVNHISSALSSLANHTSEVVLKSKTHIEPWCSTLTDVLNLLKQTILDTKIENVEDFEDMKKTWIKPLFPSICSVLRWCNTSQPLRECLVEYIRYCEPP